MRKILPLSLLIIGTLFNGCSSVKETHYSDIEHLVLFNKRDDSFGEIKKEKIPVTIGLRLLKELPREKENKKEGIWGWVFMDGLKPIFKEVVIINELGTTEKPSEVDLIVKPEQWTMGFCSTEKGCVYGFKFHFINKYGVEEFSLTAEGRSVRGADVYSKYFMGEVITDYDRAKAEAIDDLMRKFQYMVLQRKEEILKISQK